MTEGVSVSATVPTTSSPDRISTCTSALGSPYTFWGYTTSRITIHQIALYIWDPSLDTGSDVIM